ncbi:MAG: phosphoadenosine phosphosulfate reductase family protein [Nanoarchaeota archaeon]
MANFVGERFLAGRGNEPSFDSFPHEVIDWSLIRHGDKIASKKMVMSTAFGMEGCALVDMYDRAIASSWDPRERPVLDVIYLDTHFLFPETHDLISKMRERYPQ